MKISYDGSKRDKTLGERGLDFKDAVQVFAAPTVTFVDDRWDYKEVRWLTIGRLSERMVAVVWTQRGDVRHIISMRKCNEREQQKFGAQLAGRRQ